MKPLDISFSGGRFRYCRPRAGGKHWIAGLLTLSAMVCSIGLAIAAYLLVQENRNLAELAAKLHQNLVAAQPSQAKPVPNLAPAKVDAFNAAINKLNIPWRDLFDSIEQATPKTIALISLEPDSAKSTLVLIAEASSPESMLDYLVQLKAQPLFTNVLLVKHEINKQDLHSPYRFRLEARWKEPAP